MKDSTHIRETTPISDPGNLNYTIHNTGSFSNFEAEFKTWQPPDEALDEDCFVACAAEIFRFLRDMALEMMTSQSPSLLHGSSFVSSKALRQRDKNFYGSPPITCRVKSNSGGSGVIRNLIHPGAILCMIELLPSVAIPKDIQIPAEKDGGAVVTADNIFKSVHSNRETSKYLDTDSSSSFEIVSPMSAGQEPATPTDHSHINTSPTDHTRKKAILCTDRSSSSESIPFFDAEEESEANHEVMEGAWLGMNEDGLRMDAVDSVSGKKVGVAVPEEVESGVCGMSEALACKVRTFCCAIYSVTLTI